MSRLIDADDLIDGYKHMGYDPTEHEEESYMEGWCKGFNAAVDHCISHVIHAPTVEPQRKGHWIKEMNVIENNGDTIIRPEWYCSQCRSIYDPIMAQRINFCCVCGADMRGEEDET